jgi:single-stranded DNA-binding protein
MDDLNSVLIEGTLTKDVELSNENGLTVCKFTLSSNRYIEKDKSIDKIVTFVTVKALSSLSEKYFYKACKGMCIRVVGQLKQDNNLLIVEAKHIEFRSKPNIKNQNVLSYNEENNIE